MRLTVDERRPFVAAFAALVGVAWLSLWWWGQSPYGRLLSHEGLDAAGGGAPLAIVFIAGWTLMIVAMMLPSSLPLVLMFAMLTRRRTDRMLLVGLLLLGYLGAWIVFGAVIHASDLGLHAAVRQFGWLGEHAWLIATLTLVAAGLYQFSPLKYRCLDKCRSPLSFITAHWRGRGERGQAFVLGVHHGLFCVGCCWLLMLLMFAVGVGNLGWMLALGAIMAFEKNLPFGRRISAPLGAVLLVAGLGVALVATFAPLALADRP
jgi:predicted metal-binding membrane protein